MVVRNSIKSIKHIIFKKNIFAASFVRKKTLIKMDNTPFILLVIIKIVYLSGRDKEQRIVCYRILFKIHKMDSCPFQEPDNLVETMYMSLSGTIPVLHKERWHLHDLKLSSRMYLLLYAIAGKYLSFFHEVVSSFHRLV